MSAFEWIIAVAAVALVAAVWSVGGALSQIAHKMPEMSQKMTDIENGINDVAHQTERLACRMGASEDELEAQRDEHATS